MMYFVDCMGQLYPESESLQVKREIGQVEDGKVVGEPQRDAPEGF